VGGRSSKGPEQQAKGVEWAEAARDRNNRLWVLSGQKQ